MSEVISELRKDYILKLLGEGKRVDGRGFDETREIILQTGVITKAEGSCKVMLGRTQVLVGVKMQVGEPYPDRPREGTIVTNAELVPLASPTFEPGPPDENAIEIARVVDRGIRVCTDLEKLFIEEGKVWSIFIDIHVLDHDGNIMDASCLGATAALATAIIPCEKYGLGENRRMELKDYPISITHAIIDGKSLIDPCLDEERISSACLTTICGTNNIVGMQKMGSSPISIQHARDMVKSSMKKAGEIREKYLRAVLECEKEGA